MHLGDSRFLDGLDGLDGGFGSLGVPEVYIARTSFNTRMDKNNPKNFKSPMEVYACLAS